MSEEKIVLYTCFNVSVTLNCKCVFEREKKTPTPTLTMYFQWELFAGESASDRSFVSLFRRTPIAEVYEADQVQIVCKSRS